MTPIEITERYGHVFARSFATFVLELVKGGVVEQPPDSLASAAVGSENDDTLAREFVQIITGNEASAPTVRQRFLEVTGDSASKGIATRLRRIIKARGLTQKQLAEKLGVTPARISSVLKNPNHSKVDTLRKITDALDIELREML